MATDLPLALQTLYAELVERAASDAFDEAFPEDGSFVQKTVRGRRYWYFQTSTKEGRTQRYVGPETPELLERIARHKQDRKEQRDRQALVSTLVRSGHLPAPQSEIGEIVAALATAGVFRLRGVLIGTIAYQTYPAMLGTRLPVTGLQTEDVDIAQFANVSVAIEDAIRPILAVLREVDASFRPVSEQTDSRRTTKYRTKSGIRVDFLTPNSGPDSDEAVALPAFATDAAQLRFLDFLIHNPEPAVVLHGLGVHVTVPAPHRYAIHKLIVARRRRLGAAKSDKDIQQATSLLEVLIRKRPHELRSAWHEAYGRGPKWRKLLGEGLRLVPVEIRDRALKTIGETRSIVDGIELTFSTPGTRVVSFDPAWDAVTFIGRNGIERVGGNAIEHVRCGVQREAIEDDFEEKEGLDDIQCVARVRELRADFEQMARLKYLKRPVEEPGSVLIRAEDLKELRTLVPKNYRSHGRDES